MQQNSKCRLCGDRHETINQIICEYSKLAQKENKITYDGVGKVIYSELCKRLKFNYITNWYDHKQESELENKMDKIFKSPDFVLKRTWYVDFAIQVNHGVKIKERWKLEKYFDLTIEQKKCGILGCQR